MPKFDLLPFLMGQLPGMRPGVNVTIHTQDERADYDDLVAKLRENAKKWFPLGGRRRWGRLAIVVGP